MTIALDTEIVATRYDPLTQTNYYTIERDGNRWTVAVHDDHFHGAAKTGSDATKAKIARREHLAKRLRDAMLGPPDA